MKTTNKKLWADWKAALMKKSKKELVDAFAKYFKKRGIIPGHPNLSEGGAIGIPQK